MLHYDAASSKFLRGELEAGRVVESSSCLHLSLSISAGCCVPLRPWERRYLMSTLLRIPFLAVLMLTGVERSDAQWLVRNSGTTDKLTDVVMLSRSIAVVVSKAGPILVTTDAGVTWQDVTLPLSYGGHWNAISFCDSASGYAAGDQSAVFWTLNGGAGWMWRYLPAKRSCYSVLCTGPGSCYVGTDSGWVFNTSDTGRTWSSEKISEWPVRSIFRWRGESLVGVSKFAITSHSFCTQYVLPSPSWGEVEIPGLEQPGSEAYDAEFAQNGGPVYIVGGHGDYFSRPVVLRKLRSDTSWQDVSPATGMSGIFTGVSAPSASSVYICGSGGVMYKSTDGGTTWGRQDVPTKLDINAICFFDETRGFAVGDSGLILYTQTGGLLGLDDRTAAIPAEFELFQNNPNPFNSATNIEYRIPDFGFVTLRVYDVLGRQVAALVNEVRRPGSYKVVFDARSLPSGVYFYMLTASPFSGERGMSRLRKLVLLK